MKDVLKIISAKGKEIIELEQEKQSLKEENTCIEKLSENCFQVKVGPPINVLEIGLKKKQAKLDSMKEIPQKLKKMIFLISVMILGGIAATILLPSILTGIIIFITSFFPIVKVCNLAKENTKKARRKLDDDIKNIMGNIDILKEKQAKENARSQKIAQLNARIVQLTSEIMNEILKFTEIGKDISLDIINLDSKSMENIGMPSFYMAYPLDVGKPLLAQVLVKTIDNKQLK